VTTKVLGAKGESYAETLLLKNGYKIIEKNFRCPLGEIDIIATKSGVLVFVEVKTRRSLAYGMPEEAVNYRKISKIKTVGEWYINKMPDLPKKYRIDVVSLVVDDGKVIREKIIEVV
jgi:putative endonuclease